MGHGCVVSDVARVRGRGEGTGSLRTLGTTPATVPLPAECRRLAGGPGTRKGARGPAL